MQAEAAFCLVQIHYIFEHDYATSLHYARWLRDRYPNNALFHVYEGRTLARLNLWPDEHQSLLDVLERQSEGKPGYRGDVMTAGPLRARPGRRALAAVRRGDPGALAARRAAPRGTAGDYKAYGRLYRGMALDALGRRDEAVYWYNRAMASKPPGEVRDKARTYLRAPYPG